MTDMSNEAVKALLRRLDSVNVFTEPLGAANLCDRSARVIRGLLAERDAARAEIAAMRADGSWHREDVIDRLESRAEKAEAERDAARDRALRDAESVARRVAEYERGFSIHAQGKASGATKAAAAIAALRANDPARLA